MEVNQQLLHKQMKHKCKKWKYKKRNVCHHKKNNKLLMNSDYYNYKRIKGEWSKFRTNNWFK